MNKLILFAVAAAAIAGSAFTFNAVAAPDSPEGSSMHAMVEPEFIFDAKLAGMKTALKLTQDQEKLWPAFEAAVRDARQARMQANGAHREERERGERPSPIAMMTEMSDHMARASQALRKIAENAEPLYAAMDETQKQHFGPLLMMLREHGPHHAGPHGEQGRGEPKPL